MIPFELRYRKPPHSVGSKVARFHDEYDAEEAGRAEFGDDFIEAIPYAKPSGGGLAGASTAHDRQVRGVDMTGRLRP